MRTLFHTRPARSDDAPGLAGLPGARQVDEALAAFTKLFELNQRLLEMVSTLQAERDGARDVCEHLEREIVHLKNVLEACRKNDGTARYEYGEPRCLDAKRPGPGERWATPYELAKAVLS